VSDFAKVVVILGVAVLLYRLVLTLLVVVLAIAALAALLQAVRWAWLYWPTARARWFTRQ
jgi:hypothetical protein